MMDLLYKLDKFKNNNKFTVKISNYIYTNLLLDPIFKYYFISKFSLYFELYTIFKIKEVIKIPIENKKLIKQVFNKQSKLYDNKIRHKILQIYNDHIFDIDVKYLVDNILDNELINMITEMYDYSTLKLSNL